MLRIIKNMFYRERPHLQPQLLKMMRNRLGKAAISSVKERLNNSYNSSQRKSTLKKNKLFKKNKSNHFFLSLPRTRKSLCEKKR